MLLIIIWDIVLSNLMDKILVVGGTGFIGSHLVDKLLKNKYEVASISFKKKSLTIKQIFIS